MIQHFQRRQFFGGLELAAETVPAVGQFFHTEIGRLRYDQITKRLPDLFIIFAHGRMQPDSLKLVKPDLLAICLCDFQYRAQRSQHGELFGRHPVSDRSHLGSVEGFFWERTEFSAVQIIKGQFRLEIRRSFRIGHIQQFKADDLPAANSFPGRKNQRRYGRIVAGIRLQWTPFKQAAIIADQTLERHRIAQSRLETGVLIEFIPFEKHDEIRIHPDNPVHLKPESRRAVFAVGHAGHVIYVAVLDDEAVQFAAEFRFPPDFPEHRQKILIVDAEIGFGHVFPFSDVECQRDLYSVKKRQNTDHFPAVFFLRFRRPAPRILHFLPVRM